MIESNNKLDFSIGDEDLAKDTFLKKWPVWLRWVLFLPSAIVVPVLFLLIQTLLHNDENGSLWLVIIRGIIYGGGFVLVGSAVAPKYQKAVALVLMILVAMVFGIGIFSSFMMGASKMGIVEGIITILSGGIATYYVFEELK